MILSPFFRGRRSPSLALPPATNYQAFSLKTSGRTNGRIPLAAQRSIGLVRDTMKSTMSEIVFIVEQDPEGGLIARALGASIFHAGG